MANLKYKGKKHLPLPKGPYTVGCIDIMTGNGTESIFIRLYYPTDEIGILEHYERWPLWIESKKYAKGHSYGTIFPLFITTPITSNYCCDVYIPAIFDAKPLTNTKPFPLVVFSHGLYCCRTTNSVVSVELASNGYIVAAIEHRDHSAGYTYYIKNKESFVPGDEGVVKGETEINLDSTSQRLSCQTNDTEKVSIPFGKRSLSRRYAKRRNQQLHKRTEECSVALDLLRDINEGTAPRNIIDTACDLKSFQGLFDMGKIALAGYSLGASTVLTGLAIDPRFRVGLCLEPWTIPIEVEEEDLPSRLTQPILFISSPGYHDSKSLEALKAFNQGEAERKFVIIAGTAHLSLCDVPFMIPNIFNVFTYGWIRGNIFTHNDISNKLMLMFLSKHLGLPVNIDHESYINSKSSLIRSGIKLE